MLKKKGALPIILLALILAAVGSISFLNSSLNRIDRSTKQIEESDPGISADVEKNTDQDREPVMNIALFGIDDMQGKTDRSDSIIILSIDKTNNSLKLSSVIRDSYVAIDGYGKDKINRAYAFGGPELAMKTLNENFNLDISKYIAVNFTDFSKIIDKLGGVKIKVSDEEASEIPNLEKGGTYNLTGEQVFAYSRITQLSGGDNERASRQSQLMENLYSVLVSKPITQYAALAGELLPAIKTNLTSKEVITFGSYILKSNPPLEHTRFPKDEDSSDKY